MKASWVAALALLCLAGCEKAVRNMYDGARDKPLRASTRFEDGAGSRPQVEGTVAEAAYPVSTGMPSAARKSLIGG